MPRDRQDENNDRELGRRAAVRTNNPQQARADTRQAQSTALARKASPTTKGGGRK